MDPVPDILIFFGRFHSLVVHLPLGFLVLAIILELVIRFRNQQQFRPLVRFVWLLSAISGLLSVFMGFALAMGGGYDEFTLTLHKFSGIALVIISGVCYLLSSSKISFIRKGQSILYSCFVLLAIISIFITGHLGGALTHGSNYLV
jgi:uncharacterized membrane protein